MAFDNPNSNLDGNENRMLPANAFPLKSAKPAGQNAESGPVEVTTELSTGTMRVWSHSSQTELDNLCALGARENPRRGFLFVSKLNGRYEAVRPSTLHRACGQLALAVPFTLPGPVLFVSIAEAGLAIGGAVYQRWLRETQRLDAVFMQSTRHEVEAEIAWMFTEKHSHARQHRVYVPENSASSAVFRAAKTLVLIDDEITTGNTMVNATLAARGVANGICQVEQVTLTDWSGGESAHLNESRTGLSTQTRSLWTGAYKFHPGLNLRGLRDPTHLETDQRLLLRGNAECANFGRAWGQDQLPKVLKEQIGLGNRVLVIGTGEFQHQPLAWARTLEKEGVDVRFQTTTRAPVKVECGIRQRFEFSDTYGGSSSSYLYNVEPSQYDQIFLCIEDQRQKVDSKLLEHLNPEIICG
jgi:hypothetical protein